MVWARDGRRDYDAAAEMRAEDFWIDRERIIVLKVVEIIQV